MPRKTDGLKSLGVQVEESIAEQFELLARKNGRSFRAELESAMKRHLANPPTVTPVEPPALPPAGVEPGPKKGRKRKAE